MDTWARIKSTVDTILKECVLTEYLEILVIANNHQTLPAFKELVESKELATGVRSVYFPVTKITPANIRGRTRVVVIRESGVFLSDDVQRTLECSLLTSARTCWLEPDELIFTV